MGEQSYNDQLRPERRPILLDDACSRITLDHEGRRRILEWFRADGALSSPGGGGGPGCGAAGGGSVQLTYHGRSLGGAAGEARPYARSVVGHLESKHCRQQLVLGERLELVADVRWSSLRPDLAAMELCSHVRTCRPWLVGHVEHFCDGDRFGLAFRGGAHRFLGMAASDGCWDAPGGTPYSGRQFLAALAERLKVEPSDALNKLPPF